MCYTLIQFECFQSFRYARPISEVTVNDRLSAAVLISFSMLNWCGAYQRAAVISTTSKTLRVIQRELRVRQEQRQICTHTSNCYMNLVSKVSASIKTLELTSGSWSCLSSDMVLISIYMKRRNKGGAFICKSNQRCGAYFVAAFIRVAVLNRSFTVTAHLLGKKGKNERFILSLGKLTLISQVRSCQTGSVVLSSWEKLEIFALFSLSLVPQ